MRNVSVKCLWGGLGCVHMCGVEVWVVEDGVYIWGERDRRGKGGKKLQR
jgi:hypothetical protein